MGIAIPQVITSDRASGNQVIDGSLKFDASKSQYLRRTFSAGNRRKSTWSGWVQRASSSASNKHVIFGADGGGDTTRTWMVGYDNTTDDTLRFEDDFTNGDITGKTNAVFRNFSGGWYHVVVALDTTQAAIGDGLKIYVNGELQTLQSTAWNQNQDTNINSAVEHKLGIDTLAGTRYFDGKLAQVYFIDGQALGPEYFGFTDPLTNTWKPKKYTGTFTRSSVNDGTTWSSSVSGTVDSSYPLSNAFGGTIGSSYTSGTRPTVGNTLTFDISSKNLTVAKVRLNTFLSVNNGNATLQVNDTDVTTNLSDGDQTHEITINGQFNNVKWSYDDGNGPYVYMRGIEVDLGTGRGYELLTDGLTDTGANSFYLPFDGNSLIGQDQSGNGNNFTPVNFGGSNSLDEATGAKPILNTTQGGTQAGVGVFGSRENVGYAVTVYDDGGGNKYYIDGVKQATLTGLIRGATYTFDTSDSTIGSTHPFRLSATSAHGTEYTNGVVAITGAATTITIPYDAPESLYYYCTSHSGMGSSITGITTNEKLADQYASNCVLAIPFTNGDVTDVSPSIACTSTKKSLTKQGDPTSSTSFNFYSSSTDFDGTGDYYTSGSETAFTFGTGDFTVEYWIDSDDLAGNQYGHLQISDTSGGLKEGYANGFAIYEGANAGTVNTAGVSASIPSTGRLIKGGVWNHIALVREGTSVRLYANGFLAGSGTSSKDMTASYLALGGYYNTTLVYNGRMQDFRIYKGVAKYNDSFEVPVTSPAILPDTPSGVSGGSKLTKITDGAVNFGNASGYLSLPNTTDVNFGSGEFTWECFAYFTSVSGSVTVMGQWENGASRRSWLIQVNDGKMQSYVSNSGNSGADAKQADSPANYMVANRWYHIAVTRSGDDMNLFIDGELITTTDLTGFTVYANTNDAFQIGAQNTSGSHKMKGSLSDVRIVKGTALYTSRFTPPTAPLTNVTNTKLLCCQSNSEGPQKTAVIPSVTGTATAMWPLDSDINDDSGNNNTLTENGGSTSFTSAGTNPFGLSNCADFAADGKYLSYAVTPASAWTIDGYIKFDDVSSGSNSYVLGWNGTDGSDTTIGLTKSNSTFTVWGSSNLSTTTVAETGRWYHVRLTTNSTSDLALYVDGVLAGRSTSSDGSPASPITIGDMQSGRFNGQIAGVRYTPTDLGAPPLGGETTSSGVTSNSPSVGVGLEGDVVATNFNPFNTDINTVRGQETGYCTFNPLKKSSEITLSNGNLDLSSSNTSNKCKVFGTFSVSTGKYYYEVTIGTNHRGSFGWATTQDSNLAQQPGDSTGDYALTFDGNKISSGSYTASYGTAFADGTIIGVRLDADAGDIAFSIDGKDLGNAFTGQTGKTFWPIAGDASSGGTIDASVNFGQKPFKFAPPDGFQPLNTANTRPVNVISRPDQYVGVTTYTGNGSTQSIDVGHEPDLLWIKNRDDTSAAAHRLFDTVRGSNKTLYPSFDLVEAEVANSLNSFNSNGFTVGSGNWVNGTNDGMVAWSWKAGGSKNTFNVDGVGYASAAAAGLTGGDITPTGASVGTKQGFSIIKFTGSGSGTPSIPHGLSEAPNFIVQKDTGAETSWRLFMYNGATWSIMNFDNASGATGATETASTSSLFYANGNGNAANTQIAYLWHDVSGLQKFGTFEGNGNANGPFVELGFKPAVVILRNLDNYGTGYDWFIFDNQRDKFNVCSRVLLTNSSNAESSSNSIDFLSNGFKLRASTNGINLNSHTIFYAAWAEAPSVDLYGGGANAR